MSRAQPTAVGTYIFAGGFTLGVKRAGFNVLAQLEDGPFGVATTTRNHPGLPVSIKPEEWPTRELAAQGVDFIYGNPPCAPFSVANASPLKRGMHKDWWKRDARVSCIHKLFTLLEIVKPRVWVWESVQPAWTRGRELVDELTEVARSWGYSASYVFLNSAHLGVPQTRRRLFVMFHDVRFRWEYPKVATETTVRQAFAAAFPGYASDPNPEHIDVGDRERDLLKGVAQGEGPRNEWERRNADESLWERDHLGRVKGRPGFSGRRVRWDRPSPTMIGGSHLYHPDIDRKLSVKECQVLCSYPVDYEFVAKASGDKYCQMARAVMPSVGQWLAGNVIRAIVEDDRITTPEVWVRNLEKGKEEKLR